MSSAPLLLLLLLLLLLRPLTVQSDFTCLTWKHMHLQAGLAWGILSDWGWRWLVAISSVPLLLLMLLYPLLPESPYWLLATGRTQEVHALLSRIARMNGRELPPGRLQPAAAHKAKVRHSHVQLAFFDTIS